jgi:hypothetical protein
VGVEPEVNGEWYGFAHQAALQAVQHGSFPGRLLEALDVERDDGEGDPGNPHTLVRQHPNRWSERGRVEGATAKRARDA